MDIIFKAMPSFNKGTMGTLFPEPINILVERHFMFRHVPKHGQFKVLKKHA